MSISEKLILMSARGDIAPMSSKDALAIEAALSTHNAEPQMTAPSVAAKADQSPMRFFSCNVDNWGALEWFKRMADACEDHDRKRRVLFQCTDKEEKDILEISANTSKMVMTSSAFHLARECKDAVAAALSAETLETYYRRQIEWSRETFGPALRTKGIIDHIKKELREIEADPHDLSEWVDVVILAMDGFWRHGGNAEDLFKALTAKQKKNMARTWPDWRTMSEDSAIEHDRSMDEFADTFDRLKAIIVECVGVSDWTSITREADLVDDVGLDSLDTVEIVMAAEEHFGVEIEDSDVVLVVTMQDAVSAVNKARRASIASKHGDAE